MRGTKIDHYFNATPADIKKAINRYSLSEMFNILKIMKFVIVHEIRMKTGHLLLNAVHS